MSRLSVRRTWRPALTSRLRFRFPRVFQFTPHAREKPELYSRILDAQGKHILWVDLFKLEYGVGEVVKYSALKTSEMMKNLRGFVKTDMEKAPSERIDPVVWYTHSMKYPTVRMWKALDGLSPKHLQLFPYEDSDNNRHLKPLDDLHHQWNDLQSLTLCNVNNPDLMKHSPRIFSQISSLTLDHCVSASYFPLAATRLKHLRLFENECCSMFCYGVDNIPNLTKVVEVLEIESTNGCDSMNKTDFKSRLRQCTNLQEFRLTAGYGDNLDIDMAYYIPPSVEKLTLCYTRSLPFLHDIEDWIQHASDPTWLPRLKSFQMAVDPESRVGGLESTLKSSPWTRNLENPPREFSPEEFDVAFERKRRVLYDVLKSKRPSIDLLA